MQRRSFMASILAAGMAPAYVGASVLMPVRKIITTQPAIWLESRTLLAGDELFIPEPASGGELRIFSAAGILLATVSAEGSTIIQQTGEATRAELWALASLARGETRVKEFDFPILRWPAAF